jgi:hypothetical protein
MLRPARCKRRGVVLDLSSEVVNPDAPDPSVRREGLVPVGDDVCNQSPDQRARILGNVVFASHAQTIRRPDGRAFSRLSDDCRTRRAEARRRDARGPPCPPDAVEDLAGLVRPRGRRRSGPIASSGRWRTT